MKEKKLSGTYRTFFYVFFVGLKCFRARVRNTDVTIAEITSESGLANHTPFNPVNSGNMHNIGIRMITWRSRERKAAMPALPMDW